MNDQTISPEELRVRERVERITSAAEGYRVAAAWLIDHRRELAELGMFDLNAMLLGSASDDFLTIYIYGTDEEKRAQCERIMGALPDMKWEEDSTSGKVGIRAHIAGNYEVFIFGTADL